MPPASSVTTTAPKYREGDAAGMSCLSRVLVRAPCSRKFGAERSRDGAAAHDATRCVADAVEPCGPIPSSNFQIVLRHEMHRRARVNCSLLRGVSFTQTNGDEASCTLGERPALAGWCEAVHPVRSHSIP